MSWIAVGLDGVLAHTDIWRGPAHIGAPIEAMVKRVKDWLADGKDVRIFTERANPDFSTFGIAVAAIEAWTEDHIGVVLPITHALTHPVDQIWHVNAVQVEPDTGIPLELT